MASFFDDFKEKKKKKKTTVQTVTPTKAVKTTKETKQATKTKTVSQSSKALGNKNKSFVKGYENRKKVSLPTVTKPSLPKQTMNGSLRTPVRAMGETKKRAAQNTAVETKRRNQQTLSAADKKLSPVQQRAVQTYKADWANAKARGDRAAMNLAHQRAEDIRRKQGYSGGVAGNEYISPKISRQDRDLLNQSGQMAMKRAKLDYDRASAAGNTMGMKEAILEMTALRKEEKYRSMDMQSAVGTDAYGRPIYGKTQREQLMGEAMGKAIPGSLLALRETANTALRNQARQRWTADKTPEMVNPNALGQRLMRESTMAGAMATQDLSGGKKLLAETAISMGQMLPGMAASAIPVVGPAIGAAMLSGQAAGAKAFELNERGILPGEVMPRALLTGGIEGLTEAIPLARLGNILTGSAGRSLVKNVLGQMAIEGTEESISYTLNYLADKAAKDPEAVWSWDELKRNALAGAIAGGALAGAGTMFNPNAQPQVENARRGFNGTDVRNSVENVESGLLRDDYTSRQDQKAMDEIDAASKLMGVQVGFQARTPGGMPRTQGNQIILEQGTQAPARFMFGRQLAGWMEQAAPESYGQFKAIIRNEPGVQSQVRAIMEDAQELGMAYTEEQALDQVAADYAGTLMENDGVLRSFTEKAKGNKPMLQQMSDGLRSLGQRLTGRQAQKAQNAAEALELAMHETIKGNRLLTGKEQRIKNRQMAQAQRWDLDRRDAITERLTEMYQDDHLPTAVRARVDQVGIEGMVDEYLNGNLPADLREFGRAIEAYEELNRNYSFLRPEEYSSAIAEATEVARQLGMNLEMADQVAEGRANAEIEGNTVRIEKWNPNPVRFLFGHEMTHYLQEKTPDSYNQFRDHVMQTVGPDAVRNKIQEYADHGVELTTEEAIDEIVADYAGQLVENRDLLNRFIQNNRQNKTLLERVLEAIRNLAAKLTGKKKTQAEEAAALLEKAMQEVRGQVKQGTEAATEGTTEGTTEASDTTSDEVKVGDEAATYEEDGKRYSIKSMNHDIAEGKMFEDLVTAGVFTKAQATRLRKNLNDLIDYMLPNANILDMNEAYGKGNRPYKAYKPNSDPLYVISLDFSTLCRKRLMTQYVIEQLQLRENRPMTAEEQLAIRSMLLDYRKQEQALQVACAMCYVESARLKAPKQMETYFKNTESVMTKYFAMKNKEFNDRVKKAQEDFKVERGYDAKDPKSVMTTAERKAFDQMSDRMRKGYEPTAEEQAIIETAKGLPKSSYLTAANLTKLNVEHPEIYDAYTTYIRNATRSKSLESDIPYYYGDSREAVSAGFIEKVNAENGMRFDSWSDFQMEHMLDMITAVIDLSVRGSKMHGYTKFPEMVRIFGKTGMQFNLSGVTEGNGFDEKGNLVFSDIEGMSKEDAIKLRKDFPETAGFQCIGVSDDHIRALLRADYIDYVIPYHISGLNKTMRRMAGIYKWEDYTKEQHATKDPKAKKPEGAENWQVEPVWSEFYTGEGENGLDIMQKTAQRYVDMCHERGLIPKFDKFRDEPGYWKLLVDRKMVNQKTGKIIEQQPVRPDFDFKLIKKEIDREVASYDPSLEQRALDYVVEHFDAVNSRIQDLKKQGTKEKKTKKQMQTVGNEMLQAVAEGVKPGARFSLKAHQSENRINELRDEIANLQEQIEEAEFYEDDPADIKRLRNQLTKARGEYDKLLNEERKATKLTSLQEILNNLDNYRLGDLHSLAEQISDSNWDDYEELSPNEMRDALREVIENLELSPLEMQSKKYGYYVRPPDTRYSLKTNDQAYLAAVERGDMETAQKMVDEAAKAAGYTIEGWHGTDAKFNEFKIGDIGYHFGTEGQAKARIENTGLRSTQEGRESRVLHLYAKIKNPLDVATDFGDWHARNTAEMLLETEQFEEDAADLYDFDVTEVNAKLSEFIRMPEGHYADKSLREYLQSLGYDGIIYENLFEDAYDDYGTFSGDASYIAFDSSQLKLADPVTYDDSGNVIPLSERFSEGNSDIRYSLKTTRRDTSGSDYERAYEMVYGKQGKPKTVEQAANQEAVGVIDRLQNLETPKPKTKAKPLPKPGERKVEAVQEDPIPAEDLAYMDELVDAAISPRLEAEFKTARDMIPGGKVEKTPLTEKGKDIGGFAYRKFVDSGDEIRKAGKQAGDKYLYYYYNQAKASTATAQNMIAMRQTDVNGKEVGESLVDIFGPIKKKGQEYFKDFQDYLLHRHNINRMGTKEERRMQAQATRYLWDFEDENPEYKGWTLPEIRDAADDGDQIAKEYLEIKKEKAFWDSKVKPVFNYEMTPEKSQARVRQYEGRYPEFKDLAKRVYAYNQNLMKYRVDSGLISKDTAEYLQKRYPNYVPTFHTQDGVNTAERGKGTKVGKTVKKATGNTGNNPFVDMDKAMAQQTMSVVRESAKNRFGQRLLNEDISQDYIINVESLAQQKALAELHDEDGFKSEQTNKDNTFTVYKDGKAYEITMTPAMYEGIKSLSKTGESDKLAIKTIIGANNVYKKLITAWNPLFTVKNFLKDLQDAFLYTGDAKAFAKNYPKAFKQIFGKGDEWKLYQALGGTASSVYETEKGVQLPTDNVAAKMVGKVAFLNQAIEQAPRLAEFMATADKGNRTQEELMEAMYKAADITTNFGRSGDVTKMLNSSFVPFLNPSIQGVDKLMRTVRDNPRAVGPWVGLIGKAAILGVAPAIINAALFGGEDDYDELNQRDKDNNFMMPLRLLNDEWEGMWLRFPRGRALAAMGAITNAGINKAQGKDVDMIDLVTTVWGNIGVVNPMTSNIMRPLMQTALLNPENPGKTWYGGDIETKAMQNKKPGERYNEKTDVVSKFVGGKLGVSPAKINYLLDSYTGVVGDIALPLLTPTNPVGKNPLSKAFVTDSTTSNRLSGDFYDMGDQLKYAQQDGDTTATIAYDYWSKVSQDLSEVNEEIRKMENDLSLDSKAKRKKYRDLKAQANEIIREGMANVEAFRKAAEEYDGEINEDAEWDVFEALTRDVLGAEKALEYDGKNTYEKAQEIVKEGGSYESYYDYLQAERALEKVLDAESSLNKLTERNITGDLLTEAETLSGQLNEEYKDLMEISLTGSNGWKPSRTDRKLSVLESMNLPEEEAFAIWKMKILDESERWDLKVMAEEGLPEIEYFRYKMATKHMNGYQDPKTGETADNSKKNMRVKVIHSMDITPAQKDIIYLQEWKPSGLKKTPWH